MSKAHRPTDGSRLPHVLATLGLAILVLLVGAVGYSVLAVVMAPSLEESAHREAVRQAALLGDELIAGTVDDAAELGQLAARGLNVDVLLVDGTDRRRSPGVRLTYRVHVTMSRPVLAGQAGAEVDVCFRQILDHESGNYTRTELPCPAVLPPPARPSPTSQPTNTPPSNATQQPAR